MNRDTCQVCSSIWFCPIQGKTQACLSDYHRPEVSSTKPEPRDICMCCSNSCRSSLLLCQVNTFFYACFALPNIFYLLSVRWAFAERTSQGCDKSFGSKHLQWGNLHDASCEFLQNILKILLCYPICSKETHHTYVQEQLTRSMHLTKCARSECNFWFYIEVKRRERTSDRH